MGLFHCNILKFHDKPILLTCQNLRYDIHCMFWSYANFFQNNAQETFLASHG